jgi:Putative Actinobacterial Holin-X, holin superfamily III
MMQDEAGDRKAPLADASTGELVGRLAEESKELVKKEVDLAKAELRTELKSEAKLAVGFVAGGVAAFLAIQILLAALVLGLAQMMSGWAAALIVGLGVLAVGAVAALVGWGYRVRHPLSKTRKTLKEDAQWAQHGLT